MLKRYNVGFELIFGEKIGIMVLAPTMDDAITIAREKISSLPLKPGSAAQRSDDGLGDRRFFTEYQRRFGDHRKAR